MKGRDSVRHCTVCSRGPSTWWRERKRLAWHSHPGLGKTSLTLVLQCRAWLTLRGWAATAISLIIALHCCWKRAFHLPWGVAVLAGLYFRWGEWMETTPAASAMGGQEGRYSRSFPLCGITLKLLSATFRYKVYWLNGSTHIICVISVGADPVMLLSSFFFV